MKSPCVYIMASGFNGTLYTGVTSNLAQRVNQHQTGTIKGFSAKYHCKILVWYEFYNTMIEAIACEKQIKAGSRQNKITLIEVMNPSWQDLYALLNQ